MTTNEGEVSKNEWRALEVECSYSTLERAARGFFPASPASRFDGDFFRAVYCSCSVQGSRR